MQKENPVEAHHAFASSAHPSTMAHATLAFHLDANNHTSAKTPTSFLPNVILEVTKLTILSQLEYSASAQNAWIGQGVISMPLA
jgi:hypothetical protein